MTARRSIAWARRRRRIVAGLLDGTYRLDSHRVVGRQPLQLDDGQLEQILTEARARGWKP
jgi:hypothetical protein